VLFIVICECVASRELQVCLFTCDCVSGASWLSYDFALSTVSLFFPSKTISPFFLGMMHVPQQWVAAHTTLPSPSVFVPVKLGCEDVVLAGIPLVPSPDSPL
jgi:hypothetical protein